MDHIYLIQIYIEIKLTLALSDIADPIIFAKKGLATFCCPSYPNSMTTGPLQTLRDRRENKCTWGDTSSGDTIILVPVLF